MNNPVCLHCGKVFNGQELMKILPIITDWSILACPYCQKEQEYKLEMTVQIVYRKINTENEEKTNEK